MLLPGGFDFRRCDEHGQAGLAPSRPQRARDPLFFDTGSSSAAHHKGNAITHEKPAQARRSTPARLRVCRKRPVGTRLRHVIAKKQLVVGVAGNIKILQLVPSEEYNSATPSATFSNCRPVLRGGAPCSGAGARDVSCANLCSNASTKEHWSSST